MKAENLSVHADKACSEPLTPLMITAHQMHKLFSPVSRLFHLTPLVSVDVLLAGDEEPGVKGGKDEAVVARLPEELDVGGVGDSGHWDAVGVFGGGAEGLWHLLLTHTPVGGHEGHATQGQGGERLDEGDARGTHLLQERHRVREKPGLTGGRSSNREKSPVITRTKASQDWKRVTTPLPWKVSERPVKPGYEQQLSSDKQG